MRAWSTALLVALTVAPVVVAQEDTTTTIMADDEYFWEAIDIFEDGTGEGYWIEVDVSVGPAVNVFLLDEENYQAYQDVDFFDPYLGIQEHSTRHAELEHRFNRAGRYYLVVDNYDYDRDEYVAQSSTVAVTTTLGFSQHPPRTVQPDEMFIPPDEWLYEAWEITDGAGSVTLEVELEVRAGSPVNLYVVDSDNFDRSQRGEPFASYRGYQHLGVLSLSQRFAIADAGDYYLLMDNLDAGTGYTSREGSIVVFTSTSEDAEAPGVGAVAVLGAVAVAAVAWTRRRA